MLLESRACRSHRRDGMAVVARAECQDKFPEVAAVHVTGPQVREVHVKARADCDGKVWVAVQALLQVEGVLPVQAGHRDREVEQDRMTEDHGAYAILTSLDILS